MSELADYLLREMNQRNWSQREAATRSGIPKTTLTDLLNNPDHVPQLRTLQALAVGFGVPLKRLIELSGFSLDEEDKVFIVLTEEERRAFSGMTPDQRRAVVELIRTLQQP
jgi:transcriptional regulator with XRE-family HTH domain